MRSGFEKPGFENEIAPERKLAETLAEHLKKNQVLLEQAHALGKSVQETELVFRGIAETLTKAGLSMEERRDLERLLERYDTQLDGLHEELERVMGQIDAIEDTVAEANAMRTAFTSRGGQA